MYKPYPMYENPAKKEEEEKWGKKLEEVKRTSLFMAMISYTAHY